MDSIKSIPKYKTRLLTFLLAALVSVTTLLSIQSLTVYAESSTEVEAEHSDGTVIQSADTKWYSTYAEGTGYKGQGVLLYLLERNGGGPVAGTSPKAYPYSATVTSYELHAQDKYNRYPEVTTWEMTSIPWADSVSNGGGFMKNSMYSNVTDIKSWLKTPSASGNSTQGIWMVKGIWGQDIAERFTNEEIILIAEPIVAVQYSQYKATHYFEINSNMTISDMLQPIKLFKAVIAFHQYDTAMSSDLSDFIDTILNFYDNDTVLNSTGGMYTSLKTQLYYLIASKNINTNLYKKLGDPVAGTAKELIEYYNSLTPLTGWTKAESGRNYYRRSAQRASYITTSSIICANANFGLWPAGTNASIIHNDANINNYSIGMLAMLAFTEDEGDLDIYKVYQDEDGNHIRTTTTEGMNPYSITEEPNTLLIEWKTSTIKPVTDPAINTPWSTLISGKPTVQSGTNPITVTTSEDERAVYILYRETGTQEVGDWTLQESEIAKPVSTGTRTTNATLSFSLGTLQNCNTDHLDCSHSCNNNCSSNNSNCSHSCSNSSSCTSTSCSHSHGESCKHYYCGHSHGTGRYKKCDSYTLQDSSLTFKLKNDKETNYPKVIATLYGTSNSTVSGTRTLTSSQTLTPSGFNYSFVIYRGNDPLNYLLKHII